MFNKRREWDSNPRALADKRFSRPPRYDHFDISPYIIIKQKTLCTLGVVLHSRGCLCQCKTYSIIKTFLCQQDFLFFSKIHSISQKSLCNRQIFWLSLIHISTELRRNIKVCTFKTTYMLHPCGIFVKNLFQNLAIEMCIRDRS